MQERFPLESLSGGMFARRTPRVEGSAYGILRSVPFVRRLRSDCGRAERGSRLRSYAESDQAPRAEARNGRGRQTAAGTREILRRIHSGRSPWKIQGRDSVLGKRGVGDRIGTGAELDTPIRVEEKVVRQDGRG